MKGRELSKGPPSADLLVCFPSRAHLSLMPKPICSPARPSEPATSHGHNRRRRPNHHRRKSGGGGGAGHGSPLLWAKPKPNNSDISEPTSPKVTCAGQIKVRPKPNSCKNWQSVMEEIERLHNSRKKKKRSAWIETLGFKKDVMQFLTCLRNIRFDFRCFGSFPTAEISSDDDDGEEDDDDDDNDGGDEEENKEENDRNSRAVFSKWFMILPENQAEKEINKGKMIRPCLDDDDDEEDDDDDDNDGGDEEENKEENDRNSRAVFSKWFMILPENQAEKEINKGKMIRPCLDDDDDEEEEDDDRCISTAPAPAPPANALLLMRCRSAPAKTWLEEKEEEEKKENEKKELEGKQRLLVMTCGDEFSKLSADIAKETWVVGGIKDMLSRSRSSKR